MMQVVFGYLYGIFIFHDAHNLLGIFGSLIICLGVVAVSWPSKDTQPGTEESPKPDLENATILEMAPLVEEPVPSPKGVG